MIKKKIATLLIICISIMLCVNVSAFADEAKVMTVKEIEPNLTGNDIVKVEINAGGPMYYEHQMYNYMTESRSEIAYLLNFIASFNISDDGKKRYVNDVSTYSVKFYLKDGDVKRCGFYSDRFYDDSEKQYAVNSDDYRRFLSFVYALKTGKIVLDKDVTFTPSDWAYKDIESAKDMGIVPKRNQINYTGKINRLEVCEISAAVLKKAGFALSSGYKNPFSDTGNSDVCLLNELNIVNGKSDTEFCPYDNITREETAKISSNLYDVIINKASGAKNAATQSVSMKYDDIDEISDWALSGADKMFKLGIMTGDDNNLFNPRADITKEEFIAALLHLYEKTSR